MGNPIDLTGQRFGRLVVLESFESFTNRRMVWRCQCDCGNVKHVATNHLRDGATTSCGCLRTELGTARLQNYIKKNGSSRRGEYGQSNKTRLYLSYGRSARRRNIEFSLSQDEFINITSKNCYYCGVEPMTISKSKGTFGQYVHNGVDRLDSNVGYVLNNCVPCCWMCNRAKLDSPLDEFLAWIDRLLEKKLTER